MSGVGLGRGIRHRLRWVAVAVTAVVVGGVMGVAVADSGSPHPPAVAVRPTGPEVITALGQGELPAGPGGPSTGGRGGGASGVFDLTPGRLCLAALASATGSTLSQVAAVPVNLQTCGLATVTPGALSGSGPQAAAFSAWQHDVPLPSPALHVRPGWAIVGRLAYLEIEGSRVVDWQGVALGLAVVIDATSVYDVDWGDGTVDSGLAGPGGPWPTGHITHAYQRAGTYTITVVERWRATWRAGGSSGAIPTGLFTRATLGLTAREVQANRDQ